MPEDVRSIRVYWFVVLGSVLITAVAVYNYLLQFMFGMGSAAISIFIASFMITIAYEAKNLKAMAVVASVYALIAWLLGYLLLGN